MQKLLKVFWILTFILGLFTQPLAAQAGSSAYAPVSSDASDLIAGVNATGRPMV